VTGKSLTRVCCIPAILQLFEQAKNDLTGVSGSPRGLLGGGFGSSAFSLSSAGRDTKSPDFVTATNGFRVAA
jgi:formylglycine-generating enzyme required for sulfatase activity